MNWSLSIILFALLMLGQGVIAQHPECNRKDHPLRGLHEPAVGGHVTVPRPDYEFVQRFHVLQKRHFPTGL